MGQTTETQAHLARLSGEGLSRVAGALGVTPAQLRTRLDRGTPFDPAECVVLHLLTGVRLAHLFELSLESVRERAESHAQRAT